MTQRQPHGRLERALHRLAFATGRAQIGLADLETRWFRRELAACSAERPVWIAGLPRAGSTLLHELLACCPEFATQTYRDVPFVATPMLWRGLSQPFWRDPGLAERAHGDGMTVSPDSPAAVEEHLWSLHFPSRYRTTTQAPWPDDVDPAFARAFADHRRKVVALRKRTEPRASRYLAKDNQHILRIPLLLQLAPDARILVPFREPAAHAASSCRQHAHFLAMHRADPFTARAMRHLGHFDFGLHRKPIDFANWLARADAEHDPNHWLAYWVAAYEALSSQAHDPRVRLVEPTRFAASRHAQALADWLGIVDATPLARAMERVRAPTHATLDTASFDTALLDRAMTLHARLRSQAAHPD